MDLTTELMAGAKKRLAMLAEKLGVTQDRLWLEMGSPKTEINQGCRRKQGGFNCNRLTWSTWNWLCY